MKSIEVIRLVIAPFASNCYLVHDGSNGHAVIIDPGGDSDLILRTIQDRKLTPTNILLTHGHIDHIMAVSILTDQFGVPVYAHVDERQILESGPIQAQMFGLPPFKTPSVSNWFKEGDALDLNGVSYKVIHTPGHSPGGSCFYIDNGIFVGDTLFESSIGRTDLPGGNYDQLIRAIKTKLFPLPEDLVVYPGHGESTTIGKEKKFNPFLQNGSPDG